MTEVIEQEVPVAENEIVEAEPTPAEIKAKNLEFQLQYQKAFKEMLFTPSGLLLLFPALERKEEKEVEVLEPELVAE